MRVYLDYNVYDAIRKERISNFLKDSKDKYYIGVAHAEEYYNEVMNDKTGKYSEEHQKIKELLNHYKTNGILNPTEGHRIQNKPEKLENVLFV